MAHQLHIQISVQCLHQSGSSISTSQPYPHGYHIGDKCIIVGAIESHSHQRDQRYTHCPYRQIEEVSVQSSLMRSPGHIDSKPHQSQSSHYHLRVGPGQEREFKREEIHARNHCDHKHTYIFNHIISDNLEEHHLPYNIRYSHFITTWWYSLTAHHCP